MSFRYRVKGSTIKGNKEGAIYIYKNLKSGKTIEKNTGFTINNREKWSRTKQKSLDRKDFLLNSSLKQLLDRCYDAYLIALDKGHILDNSWLKEVIEDRYKERTETTHYNPYLTEFINELLLTYYDGKPSAMTIRRFLAGWKRFEKEIGRRILCNELNRRIVGLYKNFLMSPSNDYSSSYQNKTFSQLITICNKAKGAGIEVPDDFSVVDRPKVTESPIVVLTNDEMEALRSIDLTNQTGLDNARFWFLLQSTTALRISDLLDLTFKDIEYREGKFWTHRKQKKTKKPVSIVIFDKWVEDKLRQNLFPYRISKQKYRKHIKEICKRAQIKTEITAMGQVGVDEKKYRKQMILRPKWEFISSHSARRYCATFLYEKEIHPSKIIKQTGHSSVSALMVYIGKIDRDYDVGKKIYEEVNLIQTRV